MSDSTVPRRRRWAPMTKSPSGMCRYATKQDITDRTAANHFTDRLKAAREVLAHLAEGTDAEQARGLEHLASCDGLFVHRPLDLGPALIAEARAAAELAVARTSYLHDRTAENGRRYLRALGQHMLRESPAAAAMRAQWRDV